MGFIQILNDAVRGRACSDDVATSSPVVGKLLALLEKLSQWVVDIPALDQPQRYGNKAFKHWMDRMKENSKQLIGELLPAELSGAVVELNVYFIQSFGNYTRIDFGTGHEAKFCAFLCCLMKLGVVTKEDAAALVLKVFSRYVELCRQLQSVYRMEPAGSQGVWGLDDFQFLPFIWGSSQLIGHPKLEPKNFIEADTAELYSKDYLFMSCIKHINSVKTGPFAEHSNVLWGISAVAEWSKVNSGLLKMYKAEVLGKFPVIQHFPFGSILSFDPVT